MIDNMFEKLKVGDIKREIISELQKIFKNFFRTSSQHLKQNVKNQFLNHTQIVWFLEKAKKNGKLEKEIKNKDQIVNHLLFSLENLTRYPKRNAVIDDADTSSGLKTTP